MNDPAIVSVHLTHGYGLADPFGFISQAHGKFFQIEFSGCQIAFNIHLDPGLVMVVIFFVDDFIHKGLNGVEGLSFLSDKNPGISSADVQQDPAVSFFSRYRGIGSDRVDDALQYCLRKIEGIFLETLSLQAI